MGVREIDRSLEQWQMGVKDLHQRMILAPAPGRVGMPFVCWPGLDGSGHGGGAGTAPQTIGRWVLAFGEGGPAAFIFEPTGGSPRT